jgi:hypothetical protein
MAFLALRGFFVSSNSILSNPIDFNFLNKFTNSFRSGALDLRKGVHFSFIKDVLWFADQIQINMSRSIFFRF